MTGWTQDRLMWQPLRRRGLGLTQMMIVTIGLALAAQYAFQYFVGARTVRVVQDNPDVAEFGPITITYQSLVAMTISVLVLVGGGLRAAAHPGGPGDPCRLRQPRPGRRLRASTSTRWCAWSGPWPPAWPASPASSTPW